MNTLRGGTLAILMVMAATGGVRSAQQGRSTNHTVTKADLERWKKELSNWGRWGRDDQLGTLNLITPAKKKQAAALVKEGFSVSLARDAETEKAVDNPGPYEHVMQGIGSDRIAVSFHGFAHTHMDSLAHKFFDGQAYNGYTPKEEVVKKENGHARNSIYNVKNGIFTRGILIDIPRLKGVEYLEPGTPIYPEDLDAWEKMAGVKVSPGDAIFIRVGRWVRRAKLGPWNVNSTTGDSAGLHASSIPWLKQRDVAIVGSESGLSLAPPGDAPMAAHDFVLITFGGYILDNCDLTALSEAAAARKRWDFLVTFAPLPIRGGTGSPVNPIATF